MPVNTVGGPAAGNEDTYIALTGISVFDADSNPATDQITVHFSVAYGTIYILTNVAGGITAADITGGGNGTNGITLTATQDQINATLAAMGGLTYLGDPDFSGTDGLTVSTYNGIASDAIGFSAMAPSSALTNPTSLVTGDVNGDGILDLVYVGDVAQLIGIRLGNGDGTFDATTSLTTGGRPNEVLLVDIDNDDDLDIVSVNGVAGGSASDGVGVQLNDGAGNFGAYQSFAALPVAYDVAASDLNGDGRVDLIVAQQESGIVSVLLAAGPAGSFAAPVNYSANAISLVTQALVAGDFTGDGRDDIICINNGGPAAAGPPATVTMLVNNGDGTFAAAIDIATGLTQPHDAGVADLDGDGDLDLVFTTIGTSRGLTVMLGNGDGTFQTGTFYATLSQAIGVTIGDVNGDGRPDLITGSGGSGTVAIFVGDGDGTFQPRIDLATGSSFAETTTLGDFDGDGDLDLAVNRGSTTGQRVFLNTIASRGDIDTKTITVMAASVINGTEGDDFIVGTPDADVINGLGGNDVLVGLGDDDILDGGAGNDILEGGDGDDMLYGSADNDSLIGGAGADSLDGGAGLDTVSYWSAAGPVDLNLQFGFADEYAADGITYLGTDTLIGIEYAIGSAFDDALVGSSGDNYLDGAGGNDIVQGGGGNDQVNGGDGDDFLSGNLGDDHLIGGNGSDNLAGQQGNDILDGGFGDDLLRGGSGDDVMDGGDGFDRIAFFPVGSDMPAGGVTVSLLLQGVAQNTGHGWDTLIGIEHVSGTALSDTIIGDGGDNWLRGSGGGDNISGGGGNDLVEVMPGSNTLDGGSGVDTWSLFGAGTETLAGVTVSLTLQDAAQDTGQGIMLANGFENLSGSVHNDQLSGDAGVNLLAGDAGNDTLNGGDGDDMLYGDGRVFIDDHGTGPSGPITTFENVAAGNDVLDGGKGDDVLLGGGGDDMLTGGQGDDIFMFSDGSGDDVITDFEKKDVIVIDAAGIVDFSDLTITSNANGDAVISWGSGDSVTLDGYKAKKLAADDFDFGVTLAAAGVDAGDGGRLPMSSAQLLGGPDIWHI